MLMITEDLNPEINLIPTSSDIISIWTYENFVYLKDDKGDLYKLNKIEGTITKVNIVDSTVVKLLPNEKLQFTKRNTKSARNF